MRADPAVVALQQERTFTETARRQQIVAAAIDTIADLGYARASLGRIAERLQISKGVISYHFPGKDELVRALVTELVTQGEAYMRRRIAAESSGVRKLRAYLESNLAFLGAQRNDVVALVDIANNARNADGSRFVDSTMLRRGTASLQELLAHYQSRGEFRADFDPVALAVAIRAAIAAVASRLVSDSALDVDHYGRELATLFEHATGKEPGQSRVRRLRGQRSHA